MYIYVSIFFWCKTFASDSLPYNNFSSSPWWKASHTDFVSLSAMSFQVFTLAADPYSTHVLGLRRCGNLNQVWVVVWKETDFKDWAGQHAGKEHLCWRAHCRHMVVSRSCNLVGYNTSNTNWHSSLFLLNFLFPLSFCLAWRKGKFRIGYTESGIRCSDSKTR